MIKYTELKSIGRKNLMDVLPLRKPFTVLVEPSSLCNFRCIQCFQSCKTKNYFTENRMHMSLDRFRTVIDQLREWGGEPIKVLKLSMYGEPLLNPDFCEMVRIARASEVAERIETTTNASLLTRAIAEKIVEYGLDYARISIYAPEQKKHESITGSRVDIRKILENLRVLQEIKGQNGSEKPFVSLKMLDSFSSENDAFLKLYKGVADELYIDKPHRWIREDGIDFMERYYRDAVGQALEDLRQHSSRRIACPMAFTTMAVRSNGDVSPCCVDFIGGTNLGNLEESRLQEIWESDRWYAFQKLQLENRKHENYSCARCDIYLNDYYTRDNIDEFPLKMLRLNRGSST